MPFPRVFAQKWIYITKRELEFGYPMNNSEQLSITPSTHPSLQTLVPQVVTYKGTDHKRRCLTSAICRFFYRFTIFSINLEISVFFFDRYQFVCCIHFLNNYHFSHIVFFIWFKGQYVCLAEEDRYIYVYMLYYN